MGKILKWTPRRTQRGDQRPPTPTPKITPEVSLPKSVMDLAKKKLTQEEANQIVREIFNDPLQIEELKRTLDQEDEHES